MTKKPLDLPILISLVVGNMIGTGIYVLPATLAEYGIYAVFAWLITSAGAIFLALTFTNLNKRFPQSGGAYTYCKHAYGSLVGFMIAYTYWISYLVSIAGITVASIGYLGYFSPLFDASTPLYQPYLVLAVEVGVVWLFAWINIVGVHTAGVTQLILTIIKVIPLLLVTLLGILHFNSDNIAFQPSILDKMSPGQALATSAALTFWAFIGLESATIPSENTTGHRVIYQATVYGMLITCAIYIASTIALMGMIPSHTLANSQFPFATAATLLFGPLAASIIAISAIISGLGALNACTLVQGQIVFAAARDQLFPKIFSKLSRQQSPIAAQYLGAIIVSILLTMSAAPTLLKQFNNIILLAGLLTLATYFVTTLSELKFALGKNYRVKHHSFKAIAVASVAMIYCGWMMLDFDWKILLVGFSIFAIAIPVYIFTHHRKFKK